MVFESGESTGNGNGNKMNLRINILEGLLSQIGDVHSARANSLKQTIKRNKTDMAQTPAQSLDLMRQVFQKELTNELKQVLERHLRTTFSPALENLRRNGHDVTDDDVNALCRSILDATKKSFGEPTPPPPPLIMKRGYESGEESDVSLASFSSQTQKKRRRGRPRKDESEHFAPAPPIGINLGHDPTHDSVRAQTAQTQQTMLKWNPDRLTSATRWITAHQLASILSIQPQQFAAKYPRIFKYICDDDDRNWLIDMKYAPPAVAKHILFVVDDVTEIVGRPVLELDRVAFMLSEAMLQKVRQRTLFTFEQLKTHYFHAAAAAAAAASPRI